MLDKFSWNHLLFSMLLHCKAILCCGIEYGTEDINDGGLSMSKTNNRQDDDVIKPLWELMPLLQGPDPVGALIPIVQQFSWVKFDELHAKCREANKRAGRYPFDLRTEIKDVLRAINGQWKTMNFGKPVLCRTGLSEVPENIRHELKNRIFAQLEIDEAKCRETTFDTIFRKGFAILDGDIPD